MPDWLDTMWQGLETARNVALGLGAALFLAALPDAVLTAACERRMHGRLRDRHPTQWHRIVAGHGSVRGWLALQAWLTDGSVLTWDDHELRSEYRRRGRHLRRAGVLVTAGGTLILAAYAF